jgi:hypothetical protein
MLCSGHASSRPPVPVARSISPMSWGQTSLNPTNGSFWLEEERKKSRIYLLGTSPQNTLPSISIKKIYKKLSFLKIRNVRKQEDLGSMMKY